MTYYSDDDNHMWRVYIEDDNHIIKIYQINGGFSLVIRSAANVNRLFDEMTNEDINKFKKWLFDSIFNNLINLEFKDV